MDESFREAGEATLILFQRDTPPDVFRREHARLEQLLPRLATIANNLPPYPPGNRLVKHLRTSIELFIDGTAQLQRRGNEFDASGYREAVALFRAGLDELNTGKDELSRLNLSCG